MRRLVGLMALADLAPAEDAVLGGDGADQAAREPGHHGELVIEQMGARIADDFLAVLGVQFDRDGVAHGAGGDEQGGFFAGDFGGALFQAIDGGVFAIDVVADFGFGHGAAHGGRGLGDGIAAQIDHAVRNSWKTSLESMTPRSVRRRRIAGAFRAGRHRGSGGSARRNSASPRRRG